MSQTDNTLDKEITYGIDKGSPDGDKTALSIRVGKKVFTFVGEEAEAINALIADREKKMLEFVIGEDEPETEYREGDAQVPPRTIYLNANMNRNQLKAEQRQRAKEWEER